MFWNSVPSAIPGFVFDLDGVLVSTADQHFKAWKSIAQRFGVQLDAAFNEQLKGVSRKESLELILNAAHMLASPEQKEQWIHDKNQLYLELIADLSEDSLLPGVLRFLDHCRSTQVPMAVASASQNALSILERTKILSYFQVVVDGLSVTNSKPDPEVFLKAAEGLQLPPQACIVFEDAQKGLIAAKAAGMHVVGIGSAENLQLADFVIPGFENFLPQDIIQWFGIHNK